jgi:hypothetical protein
MSDNLGSGFLPLELAEESLPDGQETVENGDATIWLR